MLASFGRRSRNRAPKLLSRKPSYRPLFLLYVLRLSYVLSSHPPHIRLSGRRMSTLIFSITCIEVFIFITFVALIGLPLVIVFIALANTLAIIVMFSLVPVDDLGDRTGAFFR